MRNGLPFSKPKVRLFGDPGEAQQYLGEAYNLLFQVRQFCEQSGVPVFSMQRQLPNGALVTAAIVGGEEIVAAHPPAKHGGGATGKKRKKIPYFLANFFGTPSSEDHPGGYTPEHPQHPEAQYPGPVSVWAGYNRDNVPPAPAPKTPEDKNELTPALPIEEQPGNCTWWSDQVKFKGEPVVLSWKHPFGMQGRYGFVSPKVTYSRPDGLFTVYDGGFLNTLQPVTSALPIGAGSEYTNSNGHGVVWLNGARVRLGNVARIYGAALRYDETSSGTKELMIYVITWSGSTLQLSKCQVPSDILSALKPGAKDFDFSKEETAFVTLVKSMPINAQVVQPCFLNASATACTTIAVLSGVGGFWHESFPDYGDNQSTATVLEWVFDKPSVDILKTAYVQVDRNNLGATYNYNPPVVEASLGGMVFTSKNVSILASDYEGDTPVYLYSEVTTVNRSNSYAYSQVISPMEVAMVSSVETVVEWLITSPYIHSLTVSINPADATAEAKLIHSRKGVIAEEVRSAHGGGTFSYSAESTLSGSYTTVSGVVTEDNRVFTGDIINTNGDYPITSAGTMLSGGGTVKVSFSVLGGDLRHGVVLYEVVEDSKTVIWNNPLKYTGNAFATQYFGRIDSPAVGTSVSKFKSTVFLHTNNVNVQIEQSDIKPETSAPASPFDTAGSFTGFGIGNGVDAPASHSTLYRSPNLAKSINQHYNTPLEYGDPEYSAFDRTKSKYVSFAMDASGDYTYFGFCHPETWADPKEVNAFKIKNTLHILEPETYAPGNFSTLSEPVFFGKVLDREDEIPDE